MIMWNGFCCYFCAWLLQYFRSTFSSLYSPLIPDPEDNWKLNCTLAFIWEAESPQMSERCFHGFGADARSHPPSETHPITISSDPSVLHAGLPTAQRLLIVLIAVRWGFLHPIFLRLQGFRVSRQTLTFWRLELMCAHQNSISHQSIKTLFL